MTDTDYSKLPWAVLKTPEQPEPPEPPTLESVVRELIREEQEVDE